MFFAQPKWASTRFRSWVANSTFITPPFSPFRSTSRADRASPRELRSRICSPRSASCRDRVHARWRSEIADFENQVARRAIADRRLDARPRACRTSARPARKKGMCKPLRRLSAVRMGDRADRSPSPRALEIFKIADQDGFDRQFFEQWRFRRGDGGGYYGADIGEPAGRCSTAGPARRRSRRVCRQRRSAHRASRRPVGRAACDISLEPPRPLVSARKRHQLIVRRKPGHAIEQNERRSGLFLRASPRRGASARRWRA